MPQEMPVRDTGDEIEDTLELDCREIESKFSIKIPTRLHEILDDHMRRPGPAKELQARESEGPEPGDVHIRWKIQPSGSKPGETEEEVRRKLPKCEVYAHLQGGKEVRIEPIEANDGHVLISFSKALRQLVPTGSRPSGPPYIFFRLSYPLPRAFCFRVKAWEEEQESAPPASKRLA